MAHVLLNNGRTFSQKASIRFTFVRDLWVAGPKKLGSKLVFWHGIFANSCRLFFRRWITLCSLLCSVCVPCKSGLKSRVGKVEKNKNMCDTVLKKNEFYLSINVETLVISGRTSSRRSELVIYSVGGLYCNMNSL